ncbi:MAG TPA: 3-deoxy-D-manno-octulosonic acid kinase [Psychromonas hadalis]|nr:3-deoxy-D-manno-octulosonic acid kinase [Psychromonas hadalis]
MDIIKTDKSVIYYDPNLLASDQISPSIFSSDYWQAKNAVIGSAQGRGTTWFVQLASIEGALRHYRRGGLFGKIISDHYLFFGWNKTRSLQEFKLLTLLIEKGVNVPRPIAAIATKRTFCYQGDLLSEKVPNASDLVSILQRHSLPATLYQKIGQQVRKMHDTQVNHTDLNIHNILIDDREKIWIIDFDKCAEKIVDRWKENNLERLKRSFKKEVKKRHIHWKENDWLALIEGYKG